MIVQCFCFLQIYEKRKHQYTKSKKKLLRIKKQIQTIFDTSLKLLQNFTYFLAKNIILYFYININYETHANFNFKFNNYVWQSCYG